MKWPVIVAMSVAGAVQAAPVQPPAAVVAVPPPAVVAEALLGGAVREHRASAAVYAEVRDGRIVATRTWGLSAGPGSPPADPATTRWPIASITKTFTGVAVARLLDEGRIRSLDDPANLYLKRFRLPDWQGRAIRVADLLTHRTGLDESNFGIYRPRGGTVPLPGAAYAAVMPRAVRAPGGWPSYSNFGAAAAGALVEDVSGLSFADYVATRVFQPLGMRGALLPTGPGAVPGLVVPQDQSDPARPVPLPVRPDGVLNLPSGGGLATAADMARYMQALLSPAGVPGVLSAKAQARLFAPLATTHPAMSGHAMLFETQPLGPVTLIHHGGTTEGVWCEMFLDKPRAAGVFFCVTDWWHSPGPTLPADRPGITLSIVGSFLGAAPPGLPAAAPPSGDLSRYTGTWLSKRRYLDSSARLLALAGPDAVVVTATARGLSFNGQDGYREVAPNLFGGGGPELFAFLPDGDGLALVRQFRPSAYERAGPFDNPALAGGLYLGGLALLLAAAVLLWKRARLAAWFSLAGVALGAGVIAVLALPDTASLMAAYFAGDATRFVTAAAFGGAAVLSATAAALIGLSRRLLAGGIGALAGTLLLGTALWSLHLLGVARL